MSYTNTVTSTTSMVYVSTSDAASVIPTTLMVSTFDVTTVTPTTSTVLTISTTSSMFTITYIRISVEYTI